MKILIIGATSLIAQETARLLANSGNELFLAARSPNKLAAIAADLRIRGCGAVHTKALDLAETSGHASLIQCAIEALKEIDLLLVCYGLLGGQDANLNCDQAQRVIDTNFSSVVSLLTRISPFFEAQHGGSIVVISSVAGDRGRQSNYTYGASKAALNIYLQGLRNRLYHSGVHVLTIKPGFVDSPMTAEIAKNILFSTPDRIAKSILRAIAKRRDEAYVPWFWKPIMFAIVRIPESFFKRMML
jgi:decaprenylphospho-beta-D-erythro-pentofuranosid-2-ulose 2-reductase